MAKDGVLYRYALLDDSKHTVSIDDIDRTFTRLHKFYCPHCHNEMYATFGEVQLPHFRHNGDKCQHGKYLHDLAEHVFYEEYSKCLVNGWPFFLEIRIPTPCNKACVLKKHADCKEHYIQKTVDLTKEYTFISLETKVDIDDRYRRPDVLLESFDNKQLWVEIWVSHETEEDKRRDGRIIEIKIDTEEDLEKIRQHRIVQAEGVDLFVRIFGIETDGGDVLFEDREAVSNIKYPCEQYYCYEYGENGTITRLVDKVSEQSSPELSYKVILRLNWIGAHNSIEGITGMQLTENKLQVLCSQRCYFTEKDNLIDSLIVFERRAEPVKHPHAHCDNPPRSQVRQLPTPGSVNTSGMEWVDLGLPSGTLWAKCDVDRKMTFTDAGRYFGSRMPSWRDANELRDCCNREWDDSAHALVFTGPNGKSIMFPCKENNKSYWLNAYEQDDREFGQCFHIGPDGHIWINDMSASTSIYVRLVRR